MPHNKIDRWAYHWSIDTVALSDAAVSASGAAAGSTAARSAAAFLKEPGGREW